MEPGLEDNDPDVPGRTPPQGARKHRTLIYGVEINLVNSVLNLG
jgi:hypothetical protein